jgi:hypothetical protein
MGTLLAQAYPALAEVDPREANFLGSLLPDLLRAARQSGSAQLAFHEYSLRAHKESLGIRLAAISWSIHRHGIKIASDTSIQYI